MNYSTFHSATLALIRKRDGEVLLAKATRKNPVSGLRVEFWDLPRVENLAGERADQAAFRLAKAYGFNIVESVQQVASCRIEENVRNIVTTKTVTLAICDVDERVANIQAEHAWSSVMIAAKLLEEAAMPGAFIAKILDLGLYVGHQKPVFDFTEEPRVLHRDKPKKHVATK